MRRAVLLGVLMLALILPASALAKGPEVAAVTGSDIVLNDDTSKLKEPGVANDAAAFKATRRFKALAANTTPPIGTQKFWYSRSGNALLRDRLFTLRAVTGHSEIWVSNVLDFRRRRLPQRRRPERDHRRAGLLPRGRVREQHLPEGVGRVQHPAGPRRLARAARPAGHAVLAHRRGQLLRRRREQDRDPRRQRSGRQLQRPEQQPGAVVHRRLLLVDDQHEPRPERDDDRLVRLGAPHRCQPAERAGPRRPLREQARPAVPVRGRLRARVPAPARVLREPGRGDVGERGPLGLRDRAHRLRRPEDVDPAGRLRLAPAVLPRLADGADAGEPEPARDRRAGELADVVGGPGDRRDAVRLRRGLLAHALAVRPLRLRVHVGPPPRERERPRGPAERARLLRHRQDGAGGPAPLGRRGRGGQVPRRRPRPPRHGLPRPLPAHEHELGAQLGLGECVLGGRRTAERLGLRLAPQGGRDRALGT